MNPLEVLAGAGVAVVVALATVVVALSLSLTAYIVRAVAKSIRGGDA